MAHGKRYFTTKGFVKNPISTIMLATFVGMMVMFLVMSAGIGVIPSMLGLFAGIYLVYGFQVATIDYELSRDGVRQTIRRLIPYRLSKKESQRLIRWEDVKSYKNDTDFSRRRQEYEYIKLYLRTKPREIWITNQQNKHGFDEFKLAFLEAVEKVSEAPESEVSSSEGEWKHTVESRSPRKVKIKRKKSFYKTWFAKILTGFFIFLCAAIFAWGTINGWKLTHSIRFGAILLPGTLSMAWRVFVKEEDDEKYEDNP